jgi:hypothetical protein
MVPVDTNFQFTWQETLMPDSPSRLNSFVIIIRIYLVMYLKSLRARAFLQHLILELPNLTLILVILQVLLLK